ncbi:MAG: Signal transduction histidine kinase [Candidatus Azambacteria bacterium GW2011_GWA2_42_9]|uniref:histidine kinase n=2 Tax=Candidatus Azamiibacteriota TaxID=1752741 RepID=A0A0G1BCN1_9BACT|nr:MAG: Signal transduction histidine kinase [Candidatus Azambacteria bacterium GW2011_GWB1_42_17]KKS75399.1 MAG: Signal transduction histidine kinase [Candidatus Azambacteria bacterium GW2011_GWA2_42_9]
MLSINQFFLLIAGLLTFGITLFVYRGKRDAVRQSFLLMGAGFSLWNISLVLMQIMKTPILVDFIFFISIFHFGGLLLFAKTFPQHSGTLPKRYYLYLAPMALLLAVTLPFNLLVEKVIFHPDGSLEPVNGPAFIFFVITASGYIAASLFLIIKKFKLAKGIMKEQLKYLFLGLGASFFIVFIADILLPALGIFKLNILGAASPVIFIGFTAHAIVRHRFMDIEVIIQRGLLYLGTVSAAAVVYFLSIFTIEEVFRKTFETVPLLSAIFAAFAVVIGFPYFKEWFNKTTNHFFFRGSYNYYDVAKALSRALASTLDFKKLFYSLEKIFGYNLKINKFLFLSINSSGLLQSLKNTNFSLKNIDASDFKNLKNFFTLSREPIIYEELKYQDADFEIKNLLKKLDAGAALPIFSKSRLRAVFILGPKLSEESFSDKDIELLNVFSHQAGTALENIGLYKKIKDYSGELEKKVEKRTSELKQLYDSQSKFLFDISHELQTPISIAKGNLELLSKKENFKKSSGLKTLGVIDKTLDKMSLLVSNLLSLARIDFNQNKLAGKPVRLNNLLDELYDDCQILAENKKITFHLKKIGNAVVLGDREMLRELFLNLISNALKYTDAGGKIEIILVKENSYATIKISDTGRGIAKEDLPRIFERFYKSSVNKSNIDSTGLGLAICRQIAKLHGGSISVKSEPGKGSDFIVKLPVYQKLL